MNLLQLLHMILYVICLKCVVQLNYNSLQGLLLNRTKALTQGTNTPQLPDSGHHIQPVSHSNTHMSHLADVFIYLSQTWS